ncbi:hypothetical protein CW670_10935 [Macrococcoides caseolyticum]|uniref:DUF3846 domain-containing protein n=1 Tax=Macrococcoides caseolyticum TaxID=69966 RepID=UPI000C3206A6|nr:DUF3846 domain-containing protein [Macrococcus caseolyticus]PKE73646.1 hypothetical protein CW670_10935 [Macrococcus caseolyticus]
MKNVIIVTTRGFESVELPTDSKQKSEFLQNTINGILAFNTFGNGIDMIVDDEWISKAGMDNSMYINQIIDTNNNIDYYFHGTALIVGFEEETGETVALRQDQLNYIEANFIHKRLIKGMFV